MIELSAGNMTLRELTERDCNEKYLGWINDPEVNQYLETRWNIQTLDTIKSFVTATNADPLSWLFGIFILDVSELPVHIGNIKVGPLNKNHQFADVSYFIGDKNHWGKGYATQAIRLAVNFSFENLEINRLQAGCYEKNIGSERALLKAGFFFEGTQRKKVIDANHHWQDVKTFAILR